VHEAVALADERWICVGRYLATAVSTESNDPRTRKPRVGLLDATLERKNRESPVQRKIRGSRDQ
jgi:hypothetical protein